MSLNSFSYNTHREKSSRVLIQYLNNLRRIFRALSMTLHTLNKLFMCSFIEAHMISLSRLHNHYYFLHLYLKGVDATRFIIKLHRFPEFQKRIKSTKKSYICF